MSEANFCVCEDDSDRCSFDLEECVFTCGCECHEEDDKS